MTQLTGFIEEGLSAVRDAVVEVMDRLSVDFRPRLTQALARYARRQIRFTEKLLRRLILLLAAELEPDGAAPNDRPGPDVTPRKASAHKSRANTFKLVPQLSLESESFATLRAERAAGEKQNTDPAPLLHRLGQLLQHLDNPMPLARRMAGILNTMKASGDMRPMVMPTQRLERVPHRLALIAHALPIRGNEVLRRWFDTS